MTTLVRAARPEDESAVRRVGEAGFATMRSLYSPNPAAHASLAVIALSLERLVAEVDGQVVGTVRYGVFENRLRVIGLVVLPTARRRGVARVLVDALATVA